MSEQVTVEEARAHDLIYCEDKADYDDLIARLRSQWPNAVFEDGSDEIHEYRFGVTVADITQDELYRFMLRNKFATQGLCFNLDMHDKPKHILELVKESQS